MDLSVSPVGRPAGGGVGGTSSYFLQTAASLLLYYIRRKDVFLITAGGKDVGEKMDARLLMSGMTEGGEMVRPPSAGVRALR
jgi:hypothetical protein